VVLKMSDGMTTDERNAIERFPLVAEEYFRLIDDCGKLNRRQLVQELSVHLARLCEVAVRLPTVEPATEDIDNTPEAVAAHPEEWLRLSTSLREIFGPLDGYWELFDPTQKEEPLFGSLAIDIAEVYLDLKDALRLQKSGAALNDIYWEWRFDFRSHWSKHATSALRVLFHISDRA
jgi:hypothetical protein